jgi:protocatechuate 3,4-dioxygenase beta subunit
MDRRTLIKGLAALAPAMGIKQVFADEKPGVAAPGFCRLISQEISGPYYVNGTQIRSDITEGLAGIPLELNLQVTDIFTCRPVPDALVEIWQANPEGFYSGVENRIFSPETQAFDAGSVDQKSETYLRGVQSTDQEGRVTFKTIFPGWYLPRPTHIHVRVIPPNFGEVATTQFYLRDEDCDEVFATEYYKHRGSSPARTAAFMASMDDERFTGDLTLSLTRSGAGYEASHVMAVTFYGDMFGELPDLYRQG